MAANFDYLIAGRVIDRATKEGVPNLVVEAWDRDTRFHDMLGSTITNVEGAFWIQLTAEYHGDYGGDETPDTFFRVYRDQQLIKSTQSDPLENMQRGRTEVLIELDLGTAPVEGRDRVKTEQIFKVANFFQLSDFRCVVDEPRDRGKMVGRFMMAAAQKSLENFDFEPFQCAGPRTGEVVGQDTQVAQANLAAKSIAVTETKTYSPGFNRESVRILSGAPSLLRAGDKVTLYEENGVVRYYSVDKPLSNQDVDAGAVTRLDGDVSELKTNMTRLDSMRTEVDQLRSTSESERAQLVAEVASVKTQVVEVERLNKEVGELRQSTATKDAEINTLKEEIKRMREEQA
ncbi:MAG TPA: hypothetical protein VJM53_03785, partial [Burkholderiales bacterium]|nr:hypothetical protein [Burkholderiales bacterium]